MKKIIINIFPSFLGIFAMYILFIALKLIFNFINGIVIDPLSVLGAGMLIIISIGVITFESLIVFRKKERFALILSIIFACISINSILTILITSLALSGIIRPTAGETKESLLYSIYLLLFFGICTIIHYYIYRKMKKNITIRVI